MYHVLGGSKCMLEKLYHIINAQNVKKNVLSKSLLIQKNVKRFVNFVLFKNISLGGFKNQFNETKCEFFYVNRSLCTKNRYSKGISVFTSDEIIMRVDFFFFLKNRFGLRI